MLKRPRAGHYLEPICINWPVQKYVQELRIPAGIQLCEDLLEVRRVTYPVVRHLDHRQPPIVDLGGPHPLTVRGDEEARVVPHLHRVHALSLDAQKLTGHEMLQRSGPGLVAGPE